MADTRLSDLASASALSASDLFYVVQSAGSGGEKATGTQLLTLVGTTYVPLAGGTMTGPLTLPAGSAAAPSLNVAVNTGLYRYGASNLGVAVNGVEVMALSGSAFYLLQTGAAIQITSTGSYGFSSGATPGTSDVLLYRDAAATLAQRNGTNAQTLRVYGTYTDSSNYERLTLSTTAGTSVNITAETLGTGGDNIDIVLTPAGTGTVIVPVGVFSKPGLCFAGFTGTGMFPANSGANVVLSGSGLPVLNVAATYCGFPAASVVGWGSAGSAGANPSDIAFARNAAGIVEVCSGTAGTFRDVKLRNLLQTEYQQMTEMTAPAAPATNSVRIYAEDNGSGKTRLMALFATGAAQQIAIEP